MENLKYFFDELIVAKLIYSIYCLGVFTTVSPSSNSVRLMMSKNRTACLKENFAGFNTIEILSEVHLPGTPRAAAPCLIT